MRLLALSSALLLASISSAPSQASAVSIVSCDTTKCRAEYKDYRKFARNGSPQAQIVLAGMYYSAYGVEQNTEQALRWYKKASRTRNDENSSFASYRAGLIQLFDIGTAEAIEKGMKYLAKAALKKNQNAAYQLADLYIQGVLVKQDFNLAEHWLTVASDLGDARSQYKLGLIYEAGLLGEQQTGKAIEYYQKAAVKNNSLAIERLQLLGVIKDKSGLFAMTEGDNIETITISAPDLSELMGITLTGLKESRKFNRRQSCSKVPGSHCEHVKSIKDDDEIDMYFRLNGGL